MRDRASVANGWLRHGMHFGGAPLLNVGGFAISVAVGYA